MIRLYRSPGRPLTVQFPWFNLQYLGPSWFRHWTSWMYYYRYDKLLAQHEYTLPNTLTIFGFTIIF